MPKLEKLKRISANEERRERIRKFILENRESTAPPAPEKKSLKLPKNPLRTTAIREKPNLTSCLITTPTMDPRLAAGENNPAVRKAREKLPRTDSECQFNAPGRNFLTERKTNLAEQVVVLSPPKPIDKELKNKCDFFPKYVDSFNEKNTQTLYRESSAQTLAWLPKPIGDSVRNPRDLFSLPSVLPGNKPPGVYEVEVLERSRKRWSFYQALQVNRQRLKLIDKRLNMVKYKSILEAFEWQDWMHREEYIQECQMLRLEIVIKMFDKREREMHAASRTRMEVACERIEKRRQEALRKNEIEFQRGMRRLNNVQQRKWTKESFVESLGMPCSEFYGPLMRHGVDPARRHFTSKTGQRAFDMRIDKLAMRVNSRGFRCPFKKLNQLSQPKQDLFEAERHLCKEKALESLYKTLKSLREALEVNYTTPKCMKLKFQPLSRRKQSKKSFLLTPQALTDLYDKNDDHQPRKAKRLSFLDKDPNDGKDLIVKDESPEDMLHLIASYEASAIGTLLQFLWEETCRLKQQRNLHFITLLSMKERWKREAVESGCRQKEDVLRNLYEEIFQHTIKTKNQVTDHYINSILTDDVESMAGMEAADTVTEMAKQIDQDIERWLESFKLIQNPLNYDPLRVMLQDMVSPDLDAALQRHEKSLIVQYIVEDVIFGRVWDELEPFDVATTLTSDLIDRLIDNDLYLFSSDSESENPQKTSWYEAHAIIRKLIRQSVPGRRWKEETERIVYENYNDLLDDIFAEIIFNAENPKTTEPTALHSVYSQDPIHSTFPIQKGLSLRDMTSSLFEPKSSFYINSQVLCLIKKIHRDFNRPTTEEHQPYLETRYVVMENPTQPAVRLPGSDASKSSLLPSKVTSNTYLADS